MVNRCKGLLADLRANNFTKTCSAISVRTPQANTIVERVHQTTGNIISTFLQMYSDNEKPWEGILSSTEFAVWSEVHTTMQHTPSYVVFGRDTILNINQEANWQLI